MPVQRVEDDTTYEINVATKILQEGNFVKSRKTFPATVTYVGGSLLKFRALPVAGKEILPRKQRNIEYFMQAGIK